MARIAVISGGHGWHADDLAHAARRLGHDCVHVEVRQLGTTILCGRVPKPDYDAAVVRTLPLGSLEQVVYRMDSLYALESCGIPVVNPPRAVEVGVSKHLTSVRLAQAGLPTPDTVVSQTFEQSIAAWESLGKDAVIKPLFGAEGRGMVRVTDPETAWRTLKAVHTMQSICYLQKTVPHHGWDVRVLVLDSQPLCAMRRSNTLDWRTNIAQGGTAEPYVLTRDIAELAVRATHAVGAAFAGVDIMPTPDGWTILEVNTIPGWQTIGKVHNLDVAAELIKYVVGRLQ